MSVLEFTAWIAGGAWTLILLKILPKWATGWIPGPVRLLVVLFALWCIVQPVLSRHGIA
jgi:hypothetical protein